MNACRLCGEGEWFYAHLVYTNKFGFKTGHKWSR